jgi:hypothetical protein
MPRHPVTVASAATATALVLLPAIAGAQEQSIIRNPGDHPSYFFEAEPHAILGFAAPFYNAAGDEFGIGFRGTFNIANGFVPNINDSVAVGVGFDFGGNDRIYIPVVLQWNFWLSTHWSVFGEPGIAFGSGGPYSGVFPAFFAGGRFHFTDRIALTLRLGYPDLSVGVSFLL